MQFGVGRSALDVRRFIALSSRSSQLFRAAQKRSPVGVNSPVRAFGHVGADPFFIKRAKWAKIWDVYGNEYLDYVGSWGPTILGHAPKIIVDAVREAAERGLTFGIPNPLEVEMAQLICKWMPSIEKVRMVNSGTEATMSCIRLARGFTGRNKIIKFNGCYHGHADALLVKAGSGLATFGASSSAGVPQDVVKDTVVLEYNDVGQLEEAFAQFGDQIACVIMEPIAGNMNFVRASVPFTRRIRELTREHGALMVYDEVMTGFRVALGSA